MVQPPGIGIEAPIIRADESVNHALSVNTKSART